MFGLFKSKEQKAIDKFRKSDIGQRLVIHNAQYFGPGAVWGDFSDKGKQQISGWRRSAAEALERAFNK
jgi:hypothetical protein